ncbi:MAG TPA: histidine phosphatase family protein [Candidatus Paceibacterota bacterium]
MKTIYIVRHGESHINVSPTWIDDDSPDLTELGSEQARAIAERVSKLSIDVMITSTMRRTIATGEIIRDRMGNVPTESWKELDERRSPKKLIGQSKKDLEALRLMQTFADSFVQSGKRVEEASNFDDMSKAARAVLAKLEERSEKNILIVGHGFLTKMMVARVLYKDMLTAELFEPFPWGIRTINTGITILKHDPDDKRRPWWLYVWNDHAHLD